MHPIANLSKVLFLNFTIELLCLSDFSIIFFYFRRSTHLIIYTEILVFNDLSFIYWNAKWYTIRLEFELSFDIIHKFWDKSSSV